MSVKQDFQKIDVNLRSGGTTYKVTDGVLSGERIGFTATDPDNSSMLVFSGRIDGKNITGTVQMRGGSEDSIENWNATRD